MLELMMTTRHIYQNDNRTIDHGRSETQVTIFRMPVGVVFSINTNPSVCPAGIDPRGVPRDGSGQQQADAGVAG